MQEEENLKLKTFKNYYCDALECGLGEFLQIEDDILKCITTDEIQLVCDYAVLKNKMAGVSELFVKVPNFGFGVNSLEKFSMKGKEIVSAALMNNMPTSALVGQRLVFEIESLLDYNQPFLSDLSDLSARADLPVLIKLGQDLEEVGKVVNKFSCSPVEILEEYGFLDRECYCYGLNFIDKDDQKLLKSYNATLILAPRSDGEEGRGAINLYNFIYNHLKFVFSSGKCYNINMLGEGKLAKINTANLMHQADLVQIRDLLDALEDNQGNKLEIEVDKLAREETLLDNHVLIENSRYKELRNQIKEIAKRLKEKK